MRFIKIEPEVSVYIGERTVFDKSVVPWYVQKLHLEFEGWFGDDLVTASPVFCVTQRLKEGLESSSLSGISNFDSIEITKTENFEELYPDKELPAFFLLRINGESKKDDIAIEAGDLIISERALEFLQGFNLSEAEIEDLKNV